MNQSSQCIIKLPLQEMELEVVTQHPPSVDLAQVWQGSKRVRRWRPELQLLREPSCFLPLRLYKL